MRPLHVEEHEGKDYRKYRGAYDGGVGEPVERFAIHENVDAAGHHGAENGHIAKLAERNGETPVVVGVVRHGDEDDEYSYERHTHHVVVHVLPLVFISQPCRERCAQLSQNHEEQIYYRHALALLRVESVPSLFIDRFVARCDVLRSFHAESVAYEREQIDHHEYHAQEPHDEAA